MPRLSAGASFARTRCYSRCWHQNGARCVPTADTETSGDPRRLKHKLCDFASARATPTTTAACQQKNMLSKAKSPPWPPFSFQHLAPDLFFSFRPARACIFFSALASRDVGQTPPKQLEQMLKRKGGADAEKMQANVPNKTRGNALETTLRFYSFRAKTSKRLVGASAENKCRAGQKLKRMTAGKSS